MCGWDGVRPGVGRRARRFGGWRVVGSCVGWLARRAGLHCHGVCRFVSFIVCAFVSAFVCSFRGLFWVEIYARS